MTTNEVEIRSAFLIANKEVEYVYSNEKIGNRCTRRGCRCEKSDGGVSLPCICLQMSKLQVFFAREMRLEGMLLYSLKDVVNLIRNNE